MPCDNITETLKILINHNDCILKYSLRKQTCQGEIGHNFLLGEWIKKYSVQEILKIPLDTFLQQYSTQSITQEYLVLKHFLAIQSGLAVLTGKTSGSKNDFCTIESVAYDAQGILLTAEISVPAITKAIEACGNCVSCKIEN